MRDYTSPAITKLTFHLFLQRCLSFGLECCHAIDILFSGELS